MQWDTVYCLAAPFFCPYFIRCFKDYNWLFSLGNTSRYLRFPKKKKSKYSSINIFRLIFINTVLVLFFNDFIINPIIKKILAVLFSAYRFRFYILVGFDWLRMSRRLNESVKTLSVKTFTDRFYLIKETSHQHEKPFGINLT